MSHPCVTRFKLEVDHAKDEIWCSINVVLDIYRGVVDLEFCG